MWQQIAVYIIGVAVAAYIAVRIVRAFTRRNDPCHGCSGCSLKTDLDKKRAECRASKKPTCNCG